MAYVPLRNVPQYIQRFAAFRGNSIRGEWIPAGWPVPTGMLNERERDLLGGLDGRFPTYVVFSYDTPIAYAQDRAWYVVAQKFSRTSSRHQSAVRLAILPSSLAS